MNVNQLKQYAHLWDGSDPGWVLLNAPDLPGGYCVFHKTNQVLFHIEDDDLNEAICRKMKENGCEILNEIPRNDIEVIPSST